MSRAINRLTAIFIKNISKPGRYADGGGLYLSTTGGGRRWVFMFRWEGKNREMGLGPFNKVSLSRARSMAEQARDALGRGIYPLTARDDEKAAAAQMPELPPVEITFGECADELIRNLSGSWRNDKHAAQWKMTLEHYAAPLRALPVSQVSTENILSVLRPIWRTKAETASRVRGRIERVLSYAKAMKYRSGDNPALWRGHLDQILPKRERLTRGHHKALPYAEVPNFIVALRARQAVAARALEFTVLTAARSGEVLGARWSEIDLDAGVWTVPASRMKAQREHRVPLSPPALFLLRAMSDHRRGAFVFPTQRLRSTEDKPLSNMALEMMLRRMEVPVTVHGFRSSFRDWAAESTNFANEVCEAALAHVIENRVEAAYRRGDLFGKRKALMDAWADFCCRTSAPAVAKLAA